VLASLISGSDRSQLLGLGVWGIGNRLIAWADFGNTPVLHDSNTVRCFRHNHKIMVSEQCRLTMRPLQRLHPLQSMRLHRHVQCGRQRRSRGAAQASGQFLRADAEHHNRNGQASTLLRDSITSTIRLSTGMMGLSAVIGPWKCIVIRRPRHRQP
jgi:hypothetical protein